MIQLQPGQSSACEGHGGGELPREHIGNRPIVIRAVFAHVSLQQLGMVGIKKYL